MNRILFLQRTAGNRAVGDLMAGPGRPGQTAAETRSGPPEHQRSRSSEQNSEVTIHGERSFDFDFNNLQRAPQISDSMTVSEKNLEDGEENRIDDLLTERAPDENDGGGGAGGGGASPPAAPAKAKKAGVESFVVKWSKNSKAGAASAQLRLDYTAKFKKDADHDPALAEFRQSVMSTWDITAGPHNNRKGTTAPMHDDNYSRADDSAGRTINDVKFTANDNPGYDDLDKDDVIDYSFTAEQTIIDTSQANKVIATRGPHTATVKGKHPRKFDGVPKTLA
jgi:hypothetical protein